MSFQEIAVIWFESKKRLLKPSSVSIYYSTVFGILIPYFSNKEINNTTAQLFVIDCTKNGLAKRTIHDHLKILSYILKEGEKNGLCEAQYFDVDYPTVLEMRKRESVAFPISDIKKLRSYLVETSHANIYNLAVLLSLSLGLRIGEVTGLKFSDFDFRNKMVHINRTSQRITLFNEFNERIGTSISVGTTKTKCSNRKLPVPDIILNLIRIYSAEKGSDDFVFKGKYSKLPMDNRLLRENYCKVLDHLNIKRINFHSLRHSFASNCIASNVDIKTTSSMLGHSDIKMTLEVYTHPNFEQKKAAINKLGKLFS